MRRLTILGEDLAQLAHLAAALQRHFGVVSIVHTERPLQRAGELAPSSDAATLVCPGRAEVLSIDLCRRDFAFVSQDRGVAEQLTSFGARCFEPKDVRGLARFLTGGTPATSQPRRLRLVHRWRARRVTTLPRERQRT